MPVRACSPRARPSPMSAGAIRSFINRRPQRSRCSVGIRDRRAMNAAPAAPTANPSARALAIAALLRADGPARAPIAERADPPVWQGRTGRTHHSGWRRRVTSRLSRVARPSGSRPARCSAGLWWVRRAGPALQPPGRICSELRPRTCGDRTSLPGLPSGHVALGTMRRLRWRDDHLARVWGGLAQASSTAVAAALNLPVEAGR